MPAAVHVVANQKGGAGKTTIAVNLAAALVDALGAGGEDSPVLAASTDPQGSTVWWADRIGEDRLPFDFIDLSSEPEQLAKLRQLEQYRHVIVDTPGTLADTGLLIRTLDAADDVLVPIPPEGLAFDPTRRTIQEVLEPRGLPYRVVINNWDPRDGVSDRDQTAAYIEAHGWPRCRTIIRRYKLHTRAAPEGRVVTEYPKNRVALEAQLDFQRLATELGYGAA